MTEVATERDILARIRLALGLLPGLRLFRNSSGVAVHGDGSRVPYGIGPGGADLIGWRSVVVTPEMVGSRVAVFAALEVKGMRGNLRQEQRQFLAAVEDAGGIAGVARSEGEARRLLGVA